MFLFSESMNMYVFYELVATGQEVANICQNWGKIFEPIGPLIFQGQQRSPSNWIQNIFVTINEFALW